MDLLKGLNPMQKEAVITTEGPLLILAGAGSGKTKALTHRAAYLVKEGVMPFNILAITFTNKAAKEMRERVNHLIPEGSQVWVSTFHSLCVRILRQYIHKINFDNNFTIYDADDAVKLVRDCIKECDLNEKMFPAKSVMSAISAWKDELIGPVKAEQAAQGDFRLSQIAKVYHLYQSNLHRNNALDFDDIIFRTVDLFQKDNEVLAKYHERFRYLMVDEYQDTNTAQYRLVRLLAQKYGNLCVVGDDDQSIYGWRGANVRNILEFEKDFANAKVIKMEQNYRSTQNILDAANAVIANNTRRKHKALWTDHSKGARISYFCAPSDREESSFIAQTIDKAAQGGKKYGSYAILYRNNSQSRSLEEQLISHNIPYRLFGGVRFYDRMEIKDMLAYLKVINNPKDTVSLMRIINVPKRGIGQATLDKIAAYASANEDSFYSSLTELDDIPGLGSRVKKLKLFLAMMDGFIAFAKENTVLEVMRKVLQDTGYVAELLLTKDTEAQSRADNVQEFVSKAAEFCQNAEDNSLAAFLEEVALVADIDSYQEGADAVVLMTLHSSKGLEFPCVFLPGFENGIFPSYRSLTSGELSQLEEERRLCYVGITRAREQLYIVSARSRWHYGQTTYNSPSLFLSEIPTELME